MLDLSAILNSTWSSDIKLIFIVMAQSGEKFEELTLDDLQNKTSLSSKSIKSTLKDSNFDIVRDWADKIIKSKGTDGKLHSNDAKNILLYLNTKANKRYRDVNENLRHISSRLKDGYKYEDLIAIVDYKVNEWSNDDFMSKYLRPETLFNKTKCAMYFDELNGGEKVDEVDLQPEIIEEVSDEMIRLYGGE